MVTQQKMNNRDGKPTEQAVPSAVRRIWNAHQPGVSAGRGMAAVLIPLVLVDGDYHILFEKRALHLVIQPGEICLPGGGIEAGETPEQAARRETAEELLVAPEQVEKLAAMDPVTGPSGALVWPFVGLLHGYAGTFSADEVDHVFTVPLRWFLNTQPERHMTELVTVPEEDFPYELLPGGKSYRWRRKPHPVLFYRHPHAIIWGFTAGIVHTFVEAYRAGRDAL